LFSLLIAPVSSRLSDSQLRWFVVAVLGLSLVIESTLISTQRPRPLAVRTQVPQSWGHLHGPWKAALRYGPRLGVGPATLLNTWLWWSGAVIAALGGWPAALLFAAIFVCVRSFFTVMVPGDPAHGVELATRMRRWRQAGIKARWFSVVVVVISLGLSLLSGAT
jgi:hypothetical protein